MSKRIQEGKQLLENGQFEKAIDTLTIQITSNPNDVQAIYLRGIASRRLNKLNDSLKDFNKAISLSAFHAELYSDRGITYHMMQDGEAALRDFDKAVELEPENPYRYSSRAYIKDHHKDSKGAIADYEKAIELDPEDEISRNNLGLILERMGKIKEAKKNFMISDKLLKKKGKYVENDEFKDIVKEELEIKKSADGKVSFKSAEKKKALQEKEEKESKETKLTVSGYFGVLKSIFTSKDEFNSFLDFIKSLFSKKK